MQPLPARIGPTRPFSHETLLEICYAYRALYAEFREQGCKMNSTIYEQTLRVESEIVRWEQRSAKLRYEAKRQAARRQQVRTQASEGDGAASAGFTLLDDESVESEAASTIPSVTRDALKQWRIEKGLAPDGGAGEAPDTSGYKKSGLV